MGVARAESWRPSQIGPDSFTRSSEFKSPLILNRCVATSADPVFFLVLAGASAQGPPSVISCEALFLFISSHRLVSGAGDIKLTKDGNVLLREMVSVTKTGEKRNSGCKLLHLKWNIYYIHYFNSNKYILACSF